MGTKKEETGRGINREKGGNGTEQSHGAEYSSQEVHTLAFSFPSLILVSITMTAGFTYLKQESRAGPNRVAMSRPCLLKSLQASQHQAPPGSGH